MQIFKFIPAKIWADPCLRLTRVNASPLVVWVQMRVSSSSFL